MATHPRFGSDVDRQRVFGRLAVQQPAAPWSLVASEVRQLTAGEVPAFGVELHDTRLLDARGRDTGVRTALSPMAGVRAALAGLDETAVADEADRVRAALAHWRTGEQPTEEPTRHGTRSPIEDPTHNPMKEMTDENSIRDRRPRPHRSWLDASRPGPPGRGAGGLAGAAGARR
jgi:hypothetical protein